MNKFSKFLEVLGKIITFGQGLSIELKPCPAGHQDIIVEQDSDRDQWLVHCPRCRLRTPWYRWRWQAKRAWNNKQESNK